MPPLPHSCHMSRPLRLLDLIILTISYEEWKLRSSTLCNFSKLCKIKASNITANPSNHILN
jgi:hypothetical protein